MEVQAQQTPRRRRWPRRIGAGLLVLLIALAALVVWSRTEQALATVAQALERASAGRLEIGGVAGTLYGPLSVQRLAFRDADSEVIVEALELAWSPRALLAATLQLDRLVARSLTLTRAGGGAATPAPPASLRVPVQVALQNLRIERLVVVTGEQRLEFAPVAGSATLGLAGHRLALRELGTPWARVSGEVSIAARTPFRLSGRVGLRELGTVPLQAAELTFNGDAAGIEIAVAPTASWFTGTAKATVAPFASSALLGVALELRDVNLAGLDPALPATRASLDTVLAGKDGVLSGPVALNNTLAGRIDDTRIPLSAATGSVRFDGARLSVDDLKLTLGDAGSATGRAEVGADGYAVELATEGLRLDELHGALRPLRPAGTVRVNGRSGVEDYAAKLSEGDYALVLAARRSDERIDLDSATLRMPGGEVAATGRVDLKDPQAFTLSARLKDFDPGLFVDMPPARLKGTVEAHGVLRPAWRADVAYRIADSTFAGAALRGDGRLTARADRVTVQAAVLAVGANRLNAEGRVGAIGDRLTLKLDAPELAQLGLGAAGALRMNGWIGGSRANPAFAIEADGRALAVRGFEATTLSLAARALEGVQGQVSARAELRGVRAAGRSLERLEATLEGTRKRHELRARIDDPALALNARAQGGLADAGGWTGSIEALESSRPYAMRLAEPVALRWRPGRLQTGAGRVMLAKGELRFDPVVAGAGMLASRGTIARVALADLLAAPGPAAAFRTDLVVSGAWDIRAANTLSGSVQLARDSGDLVLTGDRPLPLEIRELRLGVVARANIIEATLRGQGEKVGTLSADLRTKAERRAGVWLIAPEAQLVLRSRITVPSLAWLGRLVNPELRTGGSLAGRVDVDGTLRAPRLQGELTGEKLRVRYGAAGVRLRDGEMKVELVQDKVIFRRIAFRGDEGTLTASGEATIAGGRAQLDLDLRADKLEAVRRDDQQLVLSGTGHVRSREGKLALEGKFTADRGLIELRAGDAPRLSSDVVIASAEPTADTAPTRLALDVTMNLGDAFHVRGGGLDVRMAGEVRVTLQEGESRPHASGSVRVAEGRYAAYGQQLAIERGVLLFDGPLDNPKLDILAVRKNQSVEAGVAITGTALSPRTALYSNPPVPDAQKLQWLVFGSGPGSAGDAEFGLASSSGQQLQAEYASVGAQLASAVYVSVGQSLRNADSFVQATLDLTDRIAVQGRTGSENAVTLVYTWEFD